MTVRATKRGAARTSFDGERADVLVCGASFAGLAVARELAGTGADVLVVDRYEIGERATSACAAPTPWLRAMGVEGSIRQEIPCMRFATPHGSVRYRLPWSWSAFDYRELCRLLYAQTDARFETAKVDGRDGGAVHTDRGNLRADLIVDALGWRRVLAAGGYQPPEAPLSRGLEVHPEGGGEDLDVWIDRSLVRRGYAWSVPAGGEQRVGVGSYDPRRHVKDSTVELAGRLDRDAVRYQGNWFPHRLRDAAEDGVFFVGDSAGHCFPLSGEGIRTAFYFGIACGRELRAVLAGERSRDDALARYRAFSAGHARAFRRALWLQRLIPALPPRALAVGLRAMGRQSIVDRAFGWYLDQAHPDYATRAPRRASPSPTSPAPA
ncbi:MAG TPA: NAD(P)/FAD-dependent oxidoreductase [Solirubrobacteraceae bacterium]|nr:NAD(P)/FAD-dependent oxidoreductase [Solirubrobacteraceae bacterium]